MRDILYKNLTSQDNHRKIMCSSEIVDRDGIRTIVHRHFVYFVREAGDETEPLEKPTLSVLKEHNHKLKYERFYCRMKSALLIKSNGKLFKVNFMHSLKICLQSLNENSEKYETSEDL